MRRIRKRWLLLFAVLAFGAWWFFLRDDGPPAHKVKIVVQDGTPVFDDADKARLRSFESFDGSPWLRAAYSAERYSGSFKSPWATRNYLYVDPGTRSSHWLVSPNEPITIEETVDFFDPPKPSAEGRRHLGTLFAVVREDTTGDGRLDRDDDQALLLADPSGSRVEVVVEGIDHYHDSHATADGRVVFYLRDGALWMGLLDFETFSFRWTESIRPR